MKRRVFGSLDFVEIGVVRAESLHDDMDTHGTCIWKGVI